MNAKLTANQLEACLDKLAAYYPGDWHTQRTAVWAQELAAMPFDVAMGAITAMARADTFPTVARLLHHAGQRTRRDDEALVVGDAVFLPGTGWLGDRAPADAAKPRAIEPVSSRETALEAIRSAREACRRRIADEAAGGAA